MNLQVSQNNWGNKSFTRIICYSAKEATEETNTLEQVGFHFLAMEQSTVSWNNQPRINKPDYVLNEAPVSDEVRVPQSFTHTDLLIFLIVQISAFLC